MSESWGGKDTCTLTQALIGRKTGLMVKDTGRRDSAGLEDMDAFFSPAVEKSPKRGRLSPAGKLSYRTKFQAAMQSDDSVPMAGTSSSYL